MSLTPRSPPWFYCIVLPPVLCVFFTVPAVHNSAIQEKEKVFQFDSTWRCNGRISFSENRNCVRSAFQSTTQSFLSSLVPIAAKGQPRTKAEAVSLPGVLTLSWISHPADHVTPTVNPPSSSFTQRTDKKQEGRGEGVSLPTGPWSVVKDRTWGKWLVQPASLSARAEGWGHIVKVQIQSHLWGCSISRRLAWTFLPTSKCRWLSARNLHNHRSPSAHTQPFPCPPHALGTLLPPSLYSGSHRGVQPTTHGPCGVQDGYEWGPTQNWKFT